jgi:hypothetical protein
MRLQPLTNRPVVQLPSTSDIYGKPSILRVFRAVMRSCSLVSPALSIECNLEIYRKERNTGIRHTKGPTPPHRSAEPRSIYLHSIEIRVAEEFHRSRTFRRAAGVKHHHSAQESDEPAGIFHALPGDSPFHVLAQRVGAT